MDTRATKLYQSVLVIAGWFALIAQFYIITLNQQTSVAEMIIRYFSYFTIQTNIVVAVCFTTLLLAPQSRWGRFFSRQQTISAITVYILVVGLIYNAILRFLWQPTGLQQVVDELLHSVIPVLVLLYWFLFTPKNNLQWKNLLPWLIYPFVYIIYILIRGSVSGFYPYPFINTTLLGLNKVLINSVGVAIVFTIISLILIFIAKSLNKNEAPIAKA